MITIDKAVTVTASSAYAQFKAIGAMQTVTSTAINMLSDCMIQNITVKDASNQKKDLVIAFFTGVLATPIADGADFNIASADINKLVALVPVTAHQTLGAGAGDYGSSYANNLGIRYQSHTLGALYFQIMANAASGPTYANTTDLSVSLGLI